METKNTSYERIFGMYEYFPRSAKIRLVSVRFRGAKITVMGLYLLLTNLFSDGLIFLFALHIKA